MDAHPEPRLQAFGRQLAEVHDWLRDQLDALRADADAYLAAPDDRLRPRELRIQCVTFCAALTRHHSGEDTDAFTRLAAEFPRLAEVLAELRRDHGLIEDSLQRLEALLTDPDPGSRSLRTELDSLAALMETHFTYEERRIAAALDQVPPPAAWRVAPPAFLRTDHA
ncbi:hemerythrin-like domain-containing protein [Streptacidiphilus sp. MAP12-20]|uniref:hemerythrin domain-containing protein n=1 Tax=Streptacidiphilus sp. MAP12-20 TaxID=3156299 RepID=UPI003511114B